MRAVAVPPRSERERLPRNLGDYERILQVISDTQAVLVLNQLIAETELRLRDLDAVPLQ